MNKPIEQPEVSDLGGLSGLGARIKSVMGDEPLSSLARRAGLAGPVLLRRYFAGSLPGTENLVGLADALGVNLLWLATGRGPMRGEHGTTTCQALGSDVDISALVSAVSAVELGLSDARISLKPEKKAEVIAAAYEIIATHGDSERSSTQIQRILRLVA